MKKLFVLLLVVAALSIPASAAYIGVNNPLAVDINGITGGAGASVKPGWQGWEIANSWTGPISKTFNNPLATKAGELPIVELDCWRKNQNYPPDVGGGRNREGGIAFVAGTGEFGPTPLKGLGTNYLKLTISNLAKNTQYEFNMWDYEAMSVWSDANKLSKWAMWSTVNPLNWLDTHGYSGYNGEPNGYGPPSGYTGTGTTMPAAMKAAAMPACGVGGDRDLMIGNYLNYDNPGLDVGDDPLGNATINRAHFSATTDSRGLITLYGWMDATDWGGSMHIPLNGFFVVPEPATIALLGLGGLALIRRKRA